MPAETARFEGLRADFRYLQGRVVEDYRANEIEKADLITDFFGPSLYSRELDSTVEMYAHLLKPGGRMVIQSAPHIGMDEQHLAGGVADASVRRWLGRARGVVLERITPEGALVIRRTEGRVKIAPLRYRGMRTVPLPPESGAAAGTRSARANYSTSIR